MWLYFCGRGASLKFRQLESSVFDALGYHLLVCLAEVFHPCLLAI